MTEVVEHHFDPECIPQSTPGAGKDSIDEPVPELRKGRFNLLSDLRQQLLVIWRICASEQQGPKFVKDQVLKIFAAISQITDGKAVISGHQQSQRRVAVVPVAWSQNEIDNAAAGMKQRVKLEAEKPTLLRFA